MRLDDTPAGRIARLDASLAKHGQAVTLRRYTGPANAPLSTWTDTPIGAKVVPATPQEIVQGISAKSARIIASPTDVGDGPVVTARDAIMIGSAKMVIAIWSPISIGDCVVRIKGRIG